MSSYPSAKKFDRRVIAANPDSVPGAYDAVGLHLCTGSSQTEMRRLVTRSDESTDPTLLMAWR